MRIRARASVLLASLLLAGGCGGEADERPPVASPSLQLGRDKAAIGSPLRFTYRFEPTGQSIQGDYSVFVHVLDQDGERLWGDDHQPPVPTSAWRSGEPVTYTRTVFLPNYPYIGPAEVRLGLYMPATGERLALAGNEVSRLEYSVGGLEILPQSQNVFLIYKDGWHHAEIHPTDPTIEWQWTRKAATVSFRNPKQDATFYLQYDARRDLFQEPQQVTVRLGDQVLGAFTADSTDPGLVTFPVTAAQMGDAEVVELMLEVDRTFQPPGDSRELGIRVFHAFIEPKEPVS